MYLLYCHVTYLTELFKIDSKCPVLNVEEDSLIYRLKNRYFIWLNTLGSLPLILWAVEVISTCVKMGWVVW